MLEKDKFLEKTSYLIFLTLIFFSQALIAETTKSKILNYNASLINSSALFIQNDGIEIQEGKIYFGHDRIKINYKYPNTGLYRAHQDITAYPNSKNHITALINLCPTNKDNGAIEFSPLCLNNYNISYTPKDKVDIGIYTKNERLEKIKR